MPPGRPQPHCGADRRTSQPSGPISVPHDVVAAPKPARVSVGAPARQRRSLVAVKAVRSEASLIVAVMVVSLTSPAATGVAGHYWVLALALIAGFVPG